MSRELLIKLLADRVKLGVLKLDQLPDALREEVELLIPS